MEKIRVLTLNVRRDEGDDGINNWEHRTGLLEKILGRIKPDIAAFQEVYLNQLNDLVKMLPGYRHVGVGREDGMQKGEFAPLFYREELELSDSGNFWLSDTPEVPSNTWPGLKRICTWASFSGDCPFTVLNTHLDNGYGETRVKSARLLRERIGQMVPNGPVILTGDFNCTPQSETYRIMEQFMTDSFEVNRSLRDMGENRPSRDCPYTFHDFKGDRFPKLVNGPIDYIWYRGKGITGNSEILLSNPSEVPGVYPSDHWPMLGEFILED